MKPILFSLGPLHLYSYGLMIALGALLSLFLMERELKKDSIGSRHFVQDLILVAILSGFVGSRLTYVLQNLSWYLERPLSILAVWEGGLIFYGGLFSGLIVLWIFLRIQKVPVLHALDFLSPYVALTQMFGRFGCFLNACCSGTFCRYPWAVSFPEGPYHVHPVQLYEAAFLLGLFGILSVYRRRKKNHGEVFTFYLILYGAGRFVMECFRDNPHFLCWSYNQWVSILLCLAGAAAFFQIRRRSAG